MQVGLKVPVSLERPLRCYALERLREFVDPRPIGTRKARHVAAACLANSEPLLLLVHDIAALAHGDERGHHFEERREPRLVLAERIVFADRRVGGARGFGAIERRVGGRKGKPWRKAECKGKQDAERFAETVFHG